ncbi:MAG: hypothetical protein ACXAEN_20240 [Candidatus Thorarchaeota archaeon]|jgi:hypothetical protein
MVTVDQILAQQAEREVVRTEIREKFPDVDFPNPALQPIFWGRKEPREMVEEKKAIVDRDTGNVFAVCSDQYQLIYHEEVVMLAIEAADGLDEFGGSQVKVRTPYEGAKLVVEVNFPNMVAEIKPGDPVNAQFTMRSSYDLGWKLSGALSAYQQVCANGMMGWVEQLGWRKRHVLSTNAQDLRLSMTKGLENYSEQFGIWQKWAEALVAEGTYETVWEALPFSEKEKEVIEELPQEGTQLLLLEALRRNELSLWDFHSVVTQFTTHNIESEMRRADLEPRVARVFHDTFGIM